MSLTAGFQMRLGGRTFILAFCQALIHTASYAKPDSGETFQPIEITLTSEVEYEHRHRDGRFEVVVTGPDGTEIRQAGFWDGGNTYKFRFAAPAPGQWTYTTAALDTRDAGLHNQSGTLLIAPSSGENQFYTRGWPRVSDDRRYFTYTDGTPLFVLGDAAHEASWKATRAEIDTYIKDRVAKSFNMTQLVPMGHQYLYPFGVRNQEGEDFFVDEDFSMPNPRFFDFIDYFISAANEAGMIVVLFPLWATFGEPHYRENGHWRGFSVEEAEIMYRYVGARYAGHNVIWYVGGDQQYQTGERRAYWSHLARVLQEATGQRQLTSIHTTGYTASFDFFDDSHEWIDFHSYTSSHGITHEAYARAGGLTAYNLPDKKPAVNAEGNYEDLFSEFWNHFHDTTGAVRLQPVHVRETAYKSILSGGLIGFFYGANGLWNWSTPRRPGGFGAHYYVEQALQFPAAEHASILREFMEDHDWYELRPAPNLIVEFDGWSPLSAAKSEQRLIAYVPAGTKSFTLDAGWLGGELRAFWFEPSSGDTLPGFPVSFPPSVRFEPPDESDWLIVVERSAPISGTDPDALDREPIFVRKISANPSPGSAEFSVWIEQGGRLTFEVVDALGRRLVLEAYELLRGDHRFAAEVQSSGVYFYRFTFRATEAERHAVHTGSFVVMR